MSPKPAAPLALLLPLLTLTACHHAPPPDTAGLIPVSLQTDWYPQPEHGGFYDAVVKGYYKAEGLNVTILPGGPFTTDALVASGKVQFSINASDHVIEAIANSGEPLVAIAATMQRDPQGIMVHADSPVHTWADLEGRSVAVRPGSTWWEFIVQRFHLTRVHEVPLTYSVANFVRDPNYIQQCFLTSEPYFAQGAGTPARVLLNADAGYAPYRVLITSRGYIEQHPDIVAKFTRASLRGWLDYLQDPGPANALIARLNPAMSRDWERYSYEQLKNGRFVTGEDPTQFGHFDPARWTTMVDQLTALHVLNHPIDPTSAYTTQFIP